MHHDHAMLPVEKLLRSNNTLNFGDNLPIFKNVPSEILVIYPVNFFSCTFEKLRIVEEINSKS